MALDDMDIELKDWLLSSEHSSYHILSVDSFYSMAPRCSSISPLLHSKIPSPFNFSDPYGNVPDHNYIDEAPKLPYPHCIPPPCDLQYNDLPTPSPIDQMQSTSLYQLSPPDIPPILSPFIQKDQLSVTHKTINKKNKPKMKIDFLEKELKELKEKNEKIEKIINEDKKEYVYVEVTKMEKLDKIKSAQNLDADNIADNTLVSLVRKACYHPHNLHISQSDQLFVRDQIKLIISQLNSSLNENKPAT